MPNDERKGGTPEGGETKASGASGGYTAVTKGGYPLFNISEPLAVLTYKWGAVRIQRTLLRIDGNRCVYGAAAAV